MSIQWITTEVGIDFWFSLFFPKDWCKRKLFSIMPQEDRNIQKSCGYVKYMSLKTQVQLNKQDMGNFLTETWAGK